MGLGSEEPKRRGQRTTSIFTILIGLAGIGLVPYCLLTVLLPAWRSLESPIANPGRVLYVTAHPDDETVFFGPSITAFRGDGHEVFLLCLTTGNARGLGKIRVEELRKAAQALQIDAEHLRIENDEVRLPDSKTVDWDMRYAEQLILSVVRRWQISTIVTFDRGGVTGHKNHMSCWQAVSSLVTRCSSSDCPAAWALLSSGKWRQYSLGIERTLHTGTHRPEKKAAYLSRSILRIFWAMHHHKTQWRWWSHVLFTRYTYSNKLQQIQPALLAVSHLRDLKASE